MYVKRDIYPGRVNDHFLLALTEVYSRTKELRWLQILVHITICMNILFRMEDFLKSKLTVPYNDWLGEKQ